MRKVSDFTISVIIPAYNCENTIECCIDSILSQSENVIQIIVIDDGSTDGTYERIKKKELQDQRLTIIRQNNKGPSASRNRGIELAEGKYLCFVDSDDIILPGMFKSLLSYQERNCGDLVISGIRKIIKRKEEKLVIDLNVKKKRYFSNKDSIRKHMIDMMRMGLNSPVGRLYKTEIIKKNHIVFDEDLDIGEDLHFNLDYIEQIDSILFLPDVFYQYNTNYSDLTFRYRENLFEKREKSIQKLKKYLRKNQIDTEIVYYLYIKLIYAVSMQEIEHKSNRKKRLHIIKTILDNKSVRKSVKRYHHKSLSEGILCLIVKLNKPFVIDLASMILVKMRKNGKFFINRMSV